MSEPRQILPWSQRVARLLFANPTRFHPAETGIHGRLLKARDDLLIALLWCTGNAIEVFVFGRAAAIVRSALAVVFRKHLTAIRPAFDAQLYAKQFDDPRCRRVRRDPLLHYAILGWIERRAPSAVFDPNHFVSRHPTLPRTIDPLLLHAALGDVRAACHEFDESAEGAAGAAKGTVLTLHHGRGGGSSTFLHLYEASLRQSGYEVLRLRAVYGGPRLGSLHGPSGGREVVFDLASDLPQLVERCRSQNVSKVVVNHVIDRPSDVFEWIPALAGSIGCGYEVILHDYYALCPRVNMVTGQGRFCDAAPPTTCVDCTAGYGSDVVGLDVHEWRPRFASFLKQASRIVVPSSDAAKRLGTVVSGTALSVWEPERDDALPSERLPVLEEHQSLKILCLGALNVPKGAHVLQALAREASSRGELLEFTLIGDADNAKALGQAGVRITGFYKPEDLDGLIEQEAPHVAFLPSIWPETWSFVLSAALRHGLPVIAFDIGAPAERLRRLSRGHLLPAEMASRATDLLAAFRQLRKQWIAT